MSFNFDLMSPQARAFVRIYTVTIKQEYELFMSTLNLMSATSLGLKCPVQAAKLAQELQVMHAEFDTALAYLANKHTLRHKPPAQEHPTIDELVKIVQISFFKLINPDKLTAAAKDKGWFSGHPLDWEKTWKTVPPNLPTPALDNAMTALFNALSKLLNKSYFDEGFSPNQAPGFPYKKLPPWSVNNEIDDEYYGNYEDDEDFPPSD
jgi:hypothetical protein